MVSKRFNDPDAIRLWRRAITDRSLRWLLEGLLKYRVLGRVLLLSSPEVFGEIQVPAGKKLSFQFRLAGFPYLSHRLQETLASLRSVATNRRGEAEQAEEAKSAINEWMGMTERQFQDVLATAILETVRRNERLRSFADSEQPITPVDLQRGIPNYEDLDWTGMKDLAPVFEGFIGKKRSKKAINRFTLNWSTLLKEHRPEILQEDIILKSAQHFVGLLKVRRVGEIAWRNLLFNLIRRSLVVPYTCTFLWCQRCPHGGFVASMSLASGRLPPLCPSCGGLARAMTAFLPDGDLLDGIRLKDGLLGAAVGWHLRTAGIRFWHALSIKGTEIDFVARLAVGDALVECKMLSVNLPPKQLARNVRGSLDQLKTHASLLESEGWKIRRTICVINLTLDHLNRLRGSGAALGSGLKNLISYESFPQWVVAQAGRLPR